MTTDERLDAIESTLVSIRSILETQVQINTGIYSTIRELEALLASLDKRVARIEKRLGIVEKDVSAIRPQIQVMYSHIRRMDDTVATMGQQGRSSTDSRLTH